MSYNHSSDFNLPESIKIGMMNKDASDSDGGSSALLRTSLLRNNTDPLNNSKRLSSGDASSSLLSVGNRGRTSKRLSLTINKLKIQSIGLVGREKEIDLLNARLQSMMIQEQADDEVDDNFSNNNDGDEILSHDTTGLQISDTNKELILIKGFSGVGKTSLARAIKKDVNSTKQGFFVEGKFALTDESNNDEPYSGIANAYSELIRELNRTDRNVLVGIGQKLCEILGAEVEPLTYLIPELEEVVTDYSTTSVSDTSSMDGMQERWKYSFRVLTRLLTAHVKPLVLVIDDLQWADKGSLDLIEDLITDAQNINPLMMIGLYRSNEVDETSDLSMLVRSLIEEKNKYGVDITEIALEGFRSTEVNHMIMKMMDTDDEESTMDLAELCFQRTLGNPFFVIEFMSMLHREELVHFNIGTLKWLYDVAEIEEATMSTANVVELLQSRMQQMPADVQVLLSIAACLGPSFRASILEMVWTNLSYVGSKGFSEVSVSTLIDFIQAEMLIEQSVGDSFRWVHDKVQEAALTFVEVDKDALRFTMGKILYLNLTGKELDDDLFDVADLLSRSKDEKSAEFGSLFLKAATKARKMSGFLSSARYVQIGIRMLPDSHWVTDQSLSLDLYTLGAQLELVLGNVPETKRYCSTVLMRSDIEMNSKIPFRVVEFRRLVQIDLDHANAITAGLALLKDLGFRFRWNRSLVAVQAVSALSRTIKAVKRLPKDFFLRLGRMDRKNRTITEILHFLIQEFIHTQAITQMVLCICHIVELSLKHGLSEYSATHFGSLGAAAILVFQMHQDAPLFREVAWSAQDHCGRAMASITMSSTYCYGLGWTLRFDSLGQAFYNFYLLAMQNGEINDAMFHLFSHCITIPFYLGKPIDKILEVLPAATLQMDEASQSMHAHFVRCFWQMWIILQDPRKVENPRVLKGEVHDVDKCDEVPIILRYHRVAEFQLLLFSNDASIGDRAIKEADQYAKGSSGYILIMIETFHRGVGLYIAARRTKQRKYKTHAKKIRKTMHKWKKAGIPNVVYYCMFLDAEQAALDGKFDEAETTYQKAIQFVAKGGYLHHAGLFNERYSDFLMGERNNKEEAKYRLEEAIRYYRDWGAHGVVERLKGSSLLKEGTSTYSGDDR